MSDKLPPYEVLGDRLGSRPAALPVPSLVEAELVASVAWLIHIRWIAGAGVILATWFTGSLLGLLAPTGILYGIGAAILAYNMVFLVADRRLTQSRAGASAFRRLAKGQVALDWLAMILLVHYSGGIESPVVLFFIFHIIIASIFFPPRTAFALAALAIALVSAMALLEFLSVLPHASITGFLDAPLYRNGLYVTATLFFFASTSLISAYLASSIQGRLQRRAEEVMRLSERLQRTGMRLQALNESSRGVNSTLELPQVLNRLVESTARAMEVRACSIRLLDASGKRLEAVAVYGLSQEYLNKGPVEIESNLLAQEVLSGKIVNLPDAPSSPLVQYAEEARKEGIRAMLSAPLVGKSGPLGVIRAYAVEPDRFGSDEEAFLEAIAAQGSIAIENALAYRAVEELDRKKGQFIRMVTHELRAPVGVIRSLLSTLTSVYNGNLPIQARDLLGRALHRVDYLQKLIDDLLDLAAGKTDVARREHQELLRLKEVVERSLRRFEVPAREKGLSLSSKVLTGAEAVLVKGTQEGFDLVFDNLLSNAIKYTNNGGRVTVTLAVGEHEARVLIEDTGIGIPADAVENLFEEFYRAPNAKAIERQGTGLGLAIVKDNLLQVNGRVSVFSAENAGSCFTVTLPVAGRMDDQQSEVAGDFNRAS